ncbi:MAG: UbiA family prenyltransferase [Rhizobiaceae bacterium]
MDARTENRTVPLAVDLDGTLIAGDLLWEGIFALIRGNPLLILFLPLWFLRGKARLKREIGQRVTIDAASLPYRAAVIERLREERKNGRRLVLATGSPRPFAEAVAAHLGLFDQVFATDDYRNLTGEAKKTALVEQFGDGGFDYAGNSHADLVVFDAARKPLVVSPDRAARKYALNHGAETIEGAGAGPRVILKMLRVHQWLKNVLIGVPVVLNHEYFRADTLWTVVLAFLSFSAAASAIYIVNDLFDLSLDRRHRTKRNRPLASGAISIPTAMLVAAALLTVSVLLASFLPLLFGVTLALYLVMTTAYSLSLKRMLLVDVLTLASLYTLRVLAGAAATGIAVSFWLLAFAIFFFLSLSLVKRYVELDVTETPNGAKLAGRGYRPEDREIVSQAGVSAAFASALVLALYINSNEVIEMYRHPWMVWPLGPIILYLTLRIWVLARRREMNDDPVVFLAGDWRSLAVCAIGAALLVAARA